MTDRDQPAATPTPTVRAVTLLVKFGLEVGMVVALAYAGSRLASGPWGVLPAICLPLQAAVAWGQWAAPRSSHRLPTPARIPLEMAIFAIAALSLVATGHPVTGIGFLALAMINAALLPAFDQSEA